jgi:hypothetical protein
MSWGVARSEYLDAKIQGLLDLGITVIAAAGNEGIDVENISPAGINEVITVAAIDKYDIPAGFNNISPSDAGVTTGHGLNLDIFAPGENVMVATGGGYYQNVSGTSFSAPLVAGVAAEIGALTNAFVPFTQMRDLILNTGTKDALLFEDARFSENQNNLVYLFTSDQNANYKLNNMTMYLGVHDDDGEPIVADMNSAMDLTSVKKVFPDVTPTWSLKWSDPELQSTYGQFVSIDSVTGVVTVTKPTTTLPPETKLKMVEFSATAQVSSVAMESPILFFFDFNPAYSETKASDITLALTNTNSISFYLNWYGIIK